MQTTIVLVPGYTNSGSEHWQSHLENKYQNTIRVEQEDWNYPAKKTWIDGLQKTLSRIAGDIILVGHSCGAITIVQWSEIHSNSKVKGALLVAPPDIDSPTALLDIQIQRPLPQNRIPFPTILVCSDNDEHLNLQQANNFAKNWGSEIVVIPNAGHIHSAAGFGNWPQGETFIDMLAGGPIMLLRAPEPCTENFGKNTS